MKRTKSRDDDERNKSKLIPESSASPLHTCTCCCCPFKNIGPPNIKGAWHQVKHQPEGQEKFSVFHFLAMNGTIKDLEVFFEKRENYFRDVWYPFWNVSHYEKYSSCPEYFLKSPHHFANSPELKRYLENKFIEADIEYDERDCGGSGTC